MKLADEEIRLNKEKKEKTVELMEIEYNSLKKISDDLIKENERLLDFKYAYKKKYERIKKEQEEEKKKYLHEIK